MLKRDVPGNGNRANKKLVSLIRVVTVESTSYLKVDKYNRENLPPLFFRYNCLLNANSNRSGLYAVRFFDGLVTLPILQLCQDSVVCGKM